MLPTALTLSGTFAMAASSDLNQSCHVEQNSDALFNEAAMEFLDCVVCSYPIVTEGFSYDCGHAVHSGCFDVFLTLENIECSAKNL